MLEITNLKSNNLELTEQEKQEVYGGAIAGLGATAVTVGDIGIKAYFNPSSLNSEYFASAASRAAITTGLGFAFGGVKGAALDS